MPDARPAARVLIVDDHPVVRLGIRQLLADEPDLAICGEAESAQQALRLAAAEAPDLAIVDLSLPDSHGLELIRALRDAAPSVAVLVLSMHDEALFAERALRVGARGYIMKREAINGLTVAVRHILSGRVYVSQALSQTLLERIGPDGPAAGGGLGDLTDRELEVFDLVGHGLTTAAIAEHLDVSVKTIETYRSNIKTKLRLRNAAELIRFATAWTQRL